MVGKKGRKITVKFKCMSLNDGNECNKYVDKERYVDNEISTLPLLIILYLWNYIITYCTKNGYAGSC